MGCPAPKNWGLIGCAENTADDGVIEYPEKPASAYFRLADAQYVLALSVDGYAESGPVASIKGSVVTRDSLGGLWISACPSIPKFRRFVALSVGRGVVMAVLTLLIDALHAELWLADLDRPTATSPSIATASPSSPLRLPRPRRLVFLVSSMPLLHQSTSILCISIARCSLARSSS